MNMTIRNAVEAVTMVRDAMVVAGLPRTSRFAGGKLTGWTEARGCTGFSIREQGDEILWRVVVSGRPHLRYDEYDSDGDRLHEPVTPERLCPRIRSTFEAQGLTVLDVAYRDHQTMWDDDVGYEVRTARPDWLEPKPAQSPRRSMFA